MGAACLDMADEEIRPESLVSCLFETLGGHKVVTAESCTGGMIAMNITSLAGSSAYFDRGFVTYSNDAKVEELDVVPEDLDKYGAVSAEIAAALAEGALENSQADISISVTGIAGPDGGTDEKPVGLVYIGISDKQSEHTESHKHVFSGNRNDIREKTTIFALRYLLERVDQINKRLEQNAL